MLKMMGHVMFSMELPRVVISVKVLGPLACSCMEQRCQQVHLFMFASKDLTTPRK